MQPSYTLHAPILCLPINSPAWRAHLGLTQPLLRTDTLTRTYPPLMTHKQTNLPPTPWQVFKMVLVVPPFNTPLHTRRSPPPHLAKESSSVGRVPAPHRLVLVGCTLGARRRRGFNPELPLARRSRPNREKCQNIHFSTCGSHRSTFSPTCANTSRHCRRSAFSPTCSWKKNWEIFDIKSATKNKTNAKTSGGKCDLRLPQVDKSKNDVLLHWFSFERMQQDAKTKCPSETHYQFSIKKSTLKCNKTYNALKEYSNLKGTRRRMRFIHLAPFKLENKCNKT